MILKKQLEIMIYSSFLTVIKTILAFLEPVSVQTRTKLNGKRTDIPQGIMESGRVIKENE